MAKKSFGKGLFFIAVLVLGGLFAIHVNAGPKGKGKGPKAPAPVPQTGQTTCYDEIGSVIACAGTGQDGEYQAGVPWPNPRFTDNGDGTVTDYLTGLIWLKDADCFGGMPWQNALNTVGDFNSDSSSYTCQDYTATYSDWRLPTIKELLSLVDYEFYDPALSNANGTDQWTNNDPFIDVWSSLSGRYWSSTSDVYWTGVGLASAFCLVSSYGGVEFVGKNTPDGHIWPVRGGN